LACRRDNRAGAQVCRKHGACPRHDAAGFSLVELTIALAVMGLIGALALPSLVKLAERTRFSLDRQDVERQLDQLPLRAAITGHNFVLSSSPDPQAQALEAEAPASAAEGAAPASGGTPESAAPEPYPVTLPDGWRITVETPIIYRYDGSCGGGTLHVSAPGAEANYLMNAPLCELRPG
jgi:prepilin-type N-terminal cleavage/methylation domain-containing protein